MDLGATPLANRFIRPDERSLPEERYPLAAVRCRSCGLVQLTVVVRPDILFGHYLYATSASAPMREHFDGLAAELRGRFAPAGTLAVEIGSNDGVLLRPLAARGLRVLGVEPASNLARAANDAGLETWNDFFGPSIARRIAEERGRAGLIVATNVLPHIDDLHGVLEGIDALLPEDGVLVAEVPYLADLLEHVEYDTIYHEHLSYFGLASLGRLFRSAGLELFDVRHLPVHGGSIRIFVGRAGRRLRTEALARRIDEEAGLGLGDVARYDRFARAVEAARRSLRSLVADLRREGKRIAALGATAKGNTLLNFCCLGSDLIEFIADSTPLKHGMLSPGMHIPVVPERALAERSPDYTLLLAWNYADAILRSHRDYVSRGGRFIHPLPLAHVLA